MSENIFNNTDYGNIVLRIKKLNPDSGRLWGKMTLPEMLEHCAIQLKLAMDLLPRQHLESTFLYRTALGRWLSLYVIPWPHGFETPGIMNMQTNNMPVGGFEEERASLLSLLGKVEITQRFAPHPFYGSINKKDWGRLMWVHLNHHLKQFGV
jgi:hypothetical protein